MSVEEQKTETETTTVETVEMEQSKLDELMNKSFGKGAKKAENKLVEELGLSNIDELKNLVTAKKEADEANKSELEKAMETIATLTNTIDTLESDTNSYKSKLELQQVANEHSIGDTDYFNHLLAQAKQSEEFQMETFVESLKSEKPYIFKNNVQPKKIDSSNNSQQSPDFGTKVKSATSMAELYALQKELKE